MQRIDAIIGPHSLERYAPLFIWCNVFLFCIGAVFWHDAVLGAAGFTPGTWGRFAYSFYAEFWAALHMGAAVLSIIGLVHPIRRWMVIVGGFLHCGQNLALAYSAFCTGGDLAVGLYASSFLLPLHLLMTAGAISEWRR